MTIRRIRAGTASTAHTCVGPLARHLDPFTAFLTSEGYASETVRTKRAWVASLSHWLTRRGAALATLDEAGVAQFQAHRHHTRGRGDLATSQQLLAFLRGRGVLPPRPAPRDRSALSRLLQDYEQFLRAERGLAPSTVVAYRSIVRRFLAEHFRNRPLRLRGLRPPDLHRVVLRAARQVSRTHARATATTLRSFVRFLYQRGAIDVDLAAALPAVAQWRWGHLPKALPPEHIERVLHSCDRRTPAGVRDYAILLLLARLGLRGGEVRALTLDDLDWERGELLVRGKGPRHEWLPLPADVGTALVHYLEHARPACATRHVFVRLHAPRHGLRLSAVCGVVRRALRRAGLNPAFKGAHLLRHSFATHLLRRGASLDEIGYLLRHRHPTTTQIYAKVDLDALRGIALPWMGGAS
jgi:site-specific recombinase XerD